MSEQDRHATSQEEGGQSNRIGLLVAVLAGLVFWGSLGLMLWSALRH